MKVREIISSRSVRTFSSLSQGKESGFLYDICDRIRSNYKFLMGPYKIEDFNFESGITFRLGTFNKFTINELQLFDYGIASETAGVSTDDVDEFLDDFEAWANTMPAPGDRFRGYVSRLEFLSEIDLGECFARFNPISKLISECLVKYGHHPRDYKVSGIKLIPDLDPQQGNALPEFSFERRAGHAYSSSVYFSTAPLRTEDHKILLEEMETSLKRQG